MNDSNCDLRPRFVFRQPPRPHGLQHFGPHVRPPHMLSESLLLPSHRQPPPMFGPRGATLPPRMLNKNCYNQRNNINFNNDYNKSHDTEYWCETCDRGFKSNVFLENHKKEHQKCNIDGCQFIAHPKVITKHIQMQHSSGLYSKIAKLSDPEEIRKWREERKKKFPTKNNINRKVAEIQEKMVRGEKMGLPHKMHRQKFTDMSDNKNERRIDFQRRKPNPKRKRPRLQKIEIPYIENMHGSSLAPFAGIKEIMVDDEIFEDRNSVKNCFTIDDDEWPENSQTIKSCENSLEDKTVCGAIVNLIANYASSEDDNSILDTKSNAEHNLTNKNSSSITEVPFAVMKKNSSDIVTNQATCINSKENFTNPKQLKVGECESDDSGPEEMKIIRSNENIIEATSDKAIVPETISNKNAKVANHLKHSTKITQRNHHYVRKVPSTLLEKLLVKEIRHERNLTLQCIRHIIKNNYFVK